MYNITPKCGKRRFKVIKSKEEKEKIEKKRKEEEKKKNDMKLLVATLKKIRIELEDIRDDLMEDLDSGKITPARFAALLINLTANVYKYYRKDDNVSLYWSTFRDFAYETSKNVLEREYESEKLDDVLSKLLNEYKDVQDFDLKYLNYSKDFLARSLADYNEAMDREELEHDLSDIERKIELQEKYNEKVKDTLVFQNVVKDLEKLLGEVVKIKEEADKNNEYSTSSLMDEYILDYSKKLWMLKQMMING